MTSHEQPRISTIGERAERLETEFMPNGVLYEMARTVTPAQDLTPLDICDILRPVKSRESLFSSWTSYVETPKIVEDLAKNREDDIFFIAKQLGMRQDVSLSKEELAPIIPKAVWVVEGGANRASIVRRALAVAAMQRFYSREYIADQPLYQFGSERPIKRIENGKLNPEYAIGMQIAGDYLPDKGRFTEFDLNLASALQAGYVIEGDVERIGDKVRPVRSILLHKDGLPQLVLIQPVSQHNSLVDGLDIMGDLAAPIANLVGCQFVIATDGIYRPRAELLANSWVALQPRITLHRFSMAPPVAIGDEPGYMVVHDGQSLYTEPRPAIVYVNEMLDLQRLYEARYYSN